MNMKRYTVINLMLVVIGCLVLNLQASNDAYANLKMNSEERMFYRRAVDAVVWSMPLINFQAMRDGLRKDAGVKTNNVAFHSQVQNWKLQTTTNNNTTPYVFIFWNVKSMTNRTIAKTK